MNIPSVNQDPAERRRILNVLAQRRYRQRNREKLSSLLGTGQAATQESPEIILQTDGGAESLPQRSSQETSDHIGPATVGASQAIQFTPQASDILVPWSLSEPSLVEEGDFAAAGPELLVGGESTIYPDDPFADYAITTPALSIIRAKVEIFNFLYGNVDFNIWDPRALSPIYLGKATNESIADFVPTLLQKTLEHHPILDAVPWPSFRDRVLYVMTLPKMFRPSVAQHDMATLTLELITAAKDAGGGIRIWGANPYSKENWEIGPVFYAKFWWAIQAEIIEISNRHRALRGERPLRVSDIQE